MASQTIFVTSDSLKRLKIPLAAITASVQASRGAPVPLVMSTLPAVSDMSMSDDDLMDPIPDQPRKRQRLTHLSPDERLQRRKMKNRVAAQTARDRKKAKMDDLGDRVTNLENQNKFLLARNRQLEKAIDILFEENKSLKSRLKTSANQPAVMEDGEMSPAQTEVEEVVEPMTIVKVKDEPVDTAAESAALVVPPQKGQAQCLASLMTFMTVMAISAYCSFWNNLAVVVVSRRYIAQQIVSKNLSLAPSPPSRETEKGQETRRKMKWWGPQQNSWSPSKN